MKKINKKVLGLTLQMSILTCMVAQAHMAYAGSFLACDGADSGSGYSHLIQELMEYLSKLLICRIN